MAPFYLYIETVLSKKYISGFLDDLWVIIYLRHYDPIKISKYIGTVLTKQVFFFKNKVHRFLFKTIPQNLKYVMDENTGSYKEGIKKDIQASK